MNTIAVSLLHPGINPNVRNLRGYTPLHIAAQQNSFEIVKLLVECPRVIIDVNDRYLNTPLCYALRHSRLDSATLLLDHTRDFTHRNKDGDTLLHIAMRHSSVTLVRTLLMNNEIKKLRHCANHKGLKPLFYAANAEVARLLTPEEFIFDACEATNKPESKKKREYRELINAETDERTRIALEILLYLRIIEKEIRQTPTFENDFLGLGRETHAGMGRKIMNDEKILKEAKRHAAYLMLNIISNITLPQETELLASRENIQQGRLGVIINSILNKRIESEYKEAIKDLFNSPRPLQKNILRLNEFIECSPLDSKWLPVAHQMLATLNTRPPQRFNVSLLDIAASSTLRDIYLYVVHQSPALSGCGNETDMHVAATGAYNGLWGTLDSHGKNPLPADEHGYTPLHYAAAANQGSAICDIFQHNRQQFTSEMRRGLQSPLKLATKYGSSHSIAALVSLGANINERDANGMTLLRMAAQSTPIKPRTINDLVDHGADMSTLFLAPEDNSFSINLFLSLVTQIIHSEDDHSSVLNSLFDYFFANYPSGYRKFFSRDLLKPNDETNAANIACVLDRGHSATLLAKTATNPTLSLTLLKRGAFFIYDSKTHEDMQKRFNSPLLNKLIELILHLNNARKTYHRTQAKDLLIEISAAEDLLEMILFGRTETRDDYSDLLQSSFFTFDKPLVALYKWFLASDLTPRTVKQILPTLGKRKFIFDPLAMQSYRYSELQRLACDDRPQAAAEVSTLLADPKIQPNAKNIDGVTALHFAAEKCLFHMVSLFVHCPRVIVDIENVLGETPLFLALRSPHANRMDIALLILQHTAMFNHTDNLNNSLLHIAAQISADPAITELLITFVKELLKNEDTRQFLSKPNNKGLRPLFYVEQNTELASLLTPDDLITQSHTSLETDIYNANFILSAQQRIDDDSLTSLITREAHTRTRLAMITLLYINEKDREVNKPYIVDKLTLDKRYAAYIILCILSNEPIPTPSLLFHSSDKIWQSRLGVLLNEIIAPTTDLAPHYKNQVIALFKPHHQKDSVAHSAPQPATQGLSVFSPSAVTTIPDAEKRSDAQFKAGGIYEL